MKRTILILLIVAISLMALVMLARADGTAEQRLTFAWEQSAEDLPNLDHWVLYMRAAAGGEAVQAIVIPYAGGEATEFESTRDLSVTGTPGAEVARYFVMTAVSKNGNESGPSNEVAHVFEIPWADVNTPIRLTVTVQVTGE